MKKILAFALSMALAAVTLAGCGGDAGNGSSTAGSEPEVQSSAPADTSDVDNTNDDDNGGFRTVEEIQASGYLTVLTNASFEPYEYMQGTEIVGVDMDLAQMIADELGVELDIKDMDFDLLVESLKAGRGDLIAAGMGYKPDRAEKVDFSIQYVLNGHLVIVPEGTDTITSVEDLNGLTIAVQEGTTAEDFVNDELEGATAKSFKDALGAGEAVATGRADCAIMDIKPAEGIVANNPGSLMLVPGLQLSDEDMCMAVGKGNTSLLEVVNSVLQKAKDDGKIDELVEFHMENSSN